MQIQAQEVEVIQDSHLSDNIGCSIRLGAEYSKVHLIQTD